MQTKLTSIGKRIPLKLSMSIHLGFGTAVYPTGRRRTLVRQSLYESEDLQAMVFLLWSKLRGGATSTYGKEQLPADLPGAVCGNAGLDGSDLRFFEILHSRRQ
jgi:hypothetical protein